VPLSLEINFAKAWVFHLFVIWDEYAELI